MIKTTIDPSRLMSNNAVGAGIFKAFIESERSVGITRENVAEIIKDVSQGAGKFSQEVEIFKALIESEISLGITSENVAKIIKDAEIKNDWKKKKYLKLSLEAKDRWE